MEETFVVSQILLLEQDVVNKKGINLSEAETKQLREILNSRANLRMKSAKGNQRKGGDVKQALEAVGNGENVSAGGRDGLLLAEKAFQQGVEAELKKAGGKLAQLSNELSGFFTSIKPQLTKRPKGTKAATPSLPPLPGTNKTKTKSSASLPPLPGGAAKAKNPKKKKKKTPA
jgi:hypothetical protein